MSNKILRCTLCDQPTNCSTKDCLRDLKNQPVCTDCYDALAIINQNQPATQMTEPTKTPRTDVLRVKCGGSSRMELALKWACDSHEQLERELNEATKERDQWKAQALANQKDKESAIKLLRCANDLIEAINQNVGLAKLIDLSKGSGMSHIGLAYWFGEYNRLTGENQDSPDSLK